jgi:hypothetical protein
MSKVHELFNFRKNRGEKVQQFANRLNYLSNANEERYSKKIIFHLKEITDFHKVIALIHRTGDEFKYDVISLKQYFSNNPKRLDLVYAPNALLLAETRQKLKISHVLLLIPSKKIPL